MHKNILQRIRETVFIIDGAMGTQLAAAGIEAGLCNDYQNIQNPEIVRSIHEKYFYAQTDAVLTNSFGANLFALERHGLADQVYQINLAAAQIARQAAGKQKYVLGDIGPSGDFLQPLGKIEPDQLKKAFSEQAQALQKGGVDAFIIETMSALDELLLAIQAVTSVSSLPIFASMAYDSGQAGYRTMMGVSPELAIETLINAGVHAVGYNCGKMSLDDYLNLARIFTDKRKELNSDVFLLAELNAGIPELTDHGAVYNVSPDEFARTVDKIKNLGFNILGGCCGTNPDFIRAVAKKLKD